MSTIALPTSAIRKHSLVTGKLSQMSRGSMHQLETKTKIYGKNLPFVADFGCNGYIIWIPFNDCDNICDPK